jgi:hypothetical protein
MENIFLTFISWDKKFKSTLHPDNVQMVTAGIEACKFTGVHTSGVTLYQGAPGSKFSKAPLV